MAEYRRVRVAVRITPEGDWDATGWGFPDGNATDGELIGQLDSGSVPKDEAADFFMEGDIPIPENRTIEGEVTEGGDE